MDSLVPTFFMVAVGMFTGYILQAKALSAICKRRNIPHAWTAWLPDVGSLKIGTIACHSQLAMRQQPNQAMYVIFRILGILRGLLLVFIVPFFLMLLHLPLIAADPSVEQYINSLFPDFDFSVMALVAMYAWFFRDFILGVPYWIFRAMGRYQVYRSCDPSNALTYLIVGIILPVSKPLFMLLVCSKDLGMPPEN